MEDVRAFMIPRFEESTDYYAIPKELWRHYNFRNPKGLTIKYKEFQLILKELFPNGLYIKDTSHFGMHYRCPLSYALNGKETIHTIL